MPHAQGVLAIEKELRAIAHQHLVPRFPKVEPHRHLKGPSGQGTGGLAKPRRRYLADDACEICVVEQVEGVETYLHFPECSHVAILVQRTFKESE
jgi:hypothetical protein